MSDLSNSDYQGLRLHTLNSLIDFSKLLCDVQKSVIELSEICGSDDIEFTKKHIKNIYDLKVWVNNFQSDFESFLNVHCKHQ